eukprot:12325963-Alexandrium_andersonii.AAC.1
MRALFNHPLPVFMSGPTPLRPDMFPRVVSMLAHTMVAGRTPTTAHPFSCVRHGGWRQACAIGKRVQ